MAEASMIGVFNAKVASFNNAVMSNDADAIAEIGVDMIKFALEQCSKAEVPSPIKDTYRKHCATVCSHLSNLAKRPASAMKTGNAGDDYGGGDPYYTERQWFSDEVPNLKFTDIVGVQEVKDAFMVDVIAPLRPEFKEIYRRFRGDKIGSQILLYGPPGTGKTHIVKCLAGALNCKIAVVQTSEVLASVVGVAEKNVRDIFSQASKLDRCIIFLDEIDSICSDRTSDDSRNTKSVLTTLLTCMDGFMKNKSEGQLRIIVAATNLPWVLDSAIKRGGRFETQIYVPLPEEKARIKFISDDLSWIPHDDNVTAEYLAKKLDGYSGADIKAIMKQIANRPLRRAVNAVIAKRRDLADNERVTLSDCNEVIKHYINSVTPEILDRFEAYNKGLTYEEVMLRRLAEQQKGDGKI